MNNELPTIECIDSLAYNIKYTASDAVCHELLCDAVMRRIVPADIALDIAEQYAVRTFTEQTAKDLQDELDRLDAIDLDEETPEETVILNAAEAYMLRRGQALYWDGSNLTTRSRHWSTVELVYHGDHGVGESTVKNLSEWRRSTALELLRSYSDNGEDSPSIPQQAYDNETPEESHLLDSIKMMWIAPGESIYYSQDGVHYRKRTWQDVLLVSHDEFEDGECSVYELDSWSRIDALQAIRSYRERYGITV